MCSAFGLCINWLIEVRAKAISGLVWVRYMRDENNDQPLISIFNNHFAIRIFTNFKVWFDWCALLLYHLKYQFNLKTRRHTSFEKKDAFFGVCHLYSQKILQSSLVFNLKSLASRSFRCCCSILSSSVTIM